MIINRYGSTVLNSRDIDLKIIWFLKRVHLDKHRYKNQNMKNLPERYNFSSSNAIIFIQTSHMLQNLSPKRILKNLNEITFFICQPAYLLTETDLKLHHYVYSLQTCYFHQYEPLLFWFNAILTVHHCLSFAYFF